MKKLTLLIISLLIILNFESSILNVVADDFEPAEEEQNSTNQFILDADDTGGDIRLQFGASLAEYLEWNSTDLRFDLSDDLRANGNLEANGTSITLDADNIGAGANISIIANQGSDNDGELRYNATTNEWEYSNDGGSFAAIGSATGGSAEYFDAYDSAGGTDVSAGWTDIPLGTERKKTTDFTHSASSAEVTINTTETYVVAYAITTDNTLGTNRSESETRLMIDTGGGYTVVPGSIGRIYNRMASEGEGTATRMLVLDLSSGDKLKMQASRISGTNTIQTLADGSALTISRVEGVGPQGPVGSSGTMDDSYNNESGEHSITVDDGNISWDINSTYNYIIDLQGTGDLQIQNGGINFAVFDDSGNFTLDGNQIIDNTNTEAFLVRKNGDTGDVFAIDTTNSTANLYQNSLVINLTAGGTITAGDVVVPGTSNLNVVRSTSTANENVVGVAVTGGTTGQTIQVAVGGIFNVTVNNTVSIGNFLEPSGTAGRAQSSGTNGGTADFGIALTSGTAGNTVTGVFKKGEVY